MFGLKNLVNFASASLDFTGLILLCTLDNIYFTNISSMLGSDLDW